jgi:hypothetical protein
MEFGKMDYIKQMGWKQIKLLKELVEFEKWLCKILRFSLMLLQKL